MSVSAALNAAGPLASGLFSIVDKLFTSDQERMEAKIKLLELEKSGELAQIAVNTQEAKHTNLFVAGWRPFIGWVCGLSFAWVYLLQPVMYFVLSALGMPPFAVPYVEMADMLTVLMGMLGLGALRTYEKTQSVSREVDPLATALNTAVRSPVDRSGKR